MTCTLELKREQPEKAQKVVVISTDTHQQLKDLSAVTGIKLHKLIDSCLRFALDHIVIVGEDD